MDPLSNYKQVILTKETFPSMFVENKKTMLLKVFELSTLASQAIKVIKGLKTEKQIFKISTNRIFH